MNSREKLIMVLVVFGALILIITLYELGQFFSDLKNQVDFTMHLARDNDERIKSIRRNVMDIKFYQEQEDLDKVEELQSYRTPQKVRQVPMGLNYDGFCPKCGTLLGYGYYMDGRMKFCPGCGQAITWDDERR